MTLRVLITAPYMQSALERFRGIFLEREIELLVPPVEERFDEHQLLQWIADVDGVICGDDAFTERVLMAAKRLKVIAKWGTGIDSIDQSACARLGISVRNTPNAFTEPVADTVLGYMLCFARRLPWMNETMRRAVWDKIPGVALGECTLGIIGMGNIGKAVARRAASFGMTIVGNDPQAMPAKLLDACSARMAPLDELLRCSDFISVNCDLNETSRDLMNEAKFKLMKPNAVVINTARGPIVNERALERALLAGSIAGAALDVFECEPLPLASPLRSLSNVLLAPHNSNSSPRAWDLVHVKTIQNLLVGLGQSPL